MTDAGIPDALLVDLGNTGLRWRRPRDGAEVAYFAHGSTDIERGLTEAWRELRPPSAVWVSSVAAAETVEAPPCLRPRAALCGAFQKQG